VLSAVIVAIMVVRPYLINQTLFNEVFTASAISDPHKLLQTLILITALERQKPLKGLRAYSRNFNRSYKYLLERKILNFNIILILFNII
jgi:hypothetical protein